MERPALFKQDNRKHANIPRTAAIKNLICMEIPALIKQDNGNMQTYQKQLASKLICIETPALIKQAN